MNSTQESVSLDSTVVSSHPDSSEDSYIKRHLKDLLKSRIFLGRYIERRLVNQRLGYRDIVVVSPAEVEFQRDLGDVQQNIKLAYPNIEWIGITDSQQLGYNTASFSIWTEIDNQPFGVFWFQVKTVQFKNNEAIVKVKCVRHISESFLEAEPILTGSAKAKETRKNIDMGTESLNQTFSDIKESLRGAVSIRNVKEFVTFLVAFVIAVFTGSSAFINFLGNFVLALVRETSILIKNSTPMMLGILDFFSKIIGGFYILIAMMFKPQTPIVPRGRNQRRLSYEPHYNNYDSRCID